MTSTTRFSRRSFLKVCAASSITTLLAACGKRTKEKEIQPLIPTDQPGSDPTLVATGTSHIPEVTQGPPPANTKLPPNWSRGKVSRARTLVFNGMGTDYPDCNPFHWGGLLLEGCAYYSPWADKTTLWMLESYQYSSDAAELTLKFRAGIEWSDGKAFSTRDVKFGFETTMRLGWSEVTEVKAVDDLTLRVKLAKSDWRFFFRNLVYCLWQGKSQLIVPEHIFSHYTDQQLQGPTTEAQMKDKTSSFFDPEKNYPVVTGPYMMVKTDPDIQREFNYADLNMYDLRPDWWAVKTGLVYQMPDVERVITVVLEESQERQVEQFTENLVDFCDSIDPDGIRSILTQASHVSTWTGDKPPYGHVAPSIFGLGFNCQLKPFDDPRLRWAIAYVIDQGDLIERVFGRDVEVANSPFPAYPAFRKLMEGISDLTGEYNFLVYDPAQSNQLMQAAGFNKDPGGFWADRNGTLVKMTLFGDGPNSRYYSEKYVELANELIQQLRHAGFDSQIELFEESPLNYEELTQPLHASDMAAKGIAPAFIDGLGGGINDPYEFFITYSTDNTKPINESSPNLTRWSDEEFNTTTDELGKLSPEDPRAANAFRKCMGIWYKNLPFVPLFQAYNCVPYNTRFWTNWPSSGNPYTSLYFSSDSALMLVINLKALS